MVTVGRFWRMVSCPGQLESMVKRKQQHRASKHAKCFKTHFNFIVQKEKIGKQKKRVQVRGGEIELKERCEEVNRERHKLRKKQGERRKRNTDYRYIKKRETKGRNGCSVILRSTEILTDVTGVPTRGGGHGGSSSWRS